MLPAQQRILGYFIEEATDHLNTIEQGLLNLQSTLNDPEMINEVFRAAHSIKGGAAMLGLSSIQHTAHRLEDCFKILQQHPVQIDEKLETLFLGVSDTLKALLEHLSEPFGLTEDVAKTLMSEAEPVFQWLQEHLEMLVQQGSSGVRSNTETAATHSQVAPKENESWGEFQAIVVQKLREMLQLFRQPATLETRQQLQECCHELARLGETLNLSKWSRLCSLAGSAIALFENSYLTLAKTVITEIKQALELVIQGRDAEIAISPQLKALLSDLESDLLETTDDFITEPASTLDTANYSEVTPPTRDNSPSDAAMQPFELEPQDSITNLSELSASLNLENEDSITSLTQLSASLNLESEDSITSLPEMSAPLNLDEDSRTSLSELAAHLNLNQDAVKNIFPGDTNDSEDDAPFNNRNIELNKLEVGIGDLNALADFVEGETADLDETRQKVEILNNTYASELEINISNSNTEDADRDLADLLSFEKEPSSDERQKNTTEKEDLTFFQLFDGFIEQDNLEAKNKETTVTNLDLSNISLPDIETNITQPQEEDFPWEILFPEPEEDTTPPKTKSELNDLFDTLILPATAPEFSQSEEDFSDFWVQDAEEKQRDTPLESLHERKFDSLVDPDAATLEESLFAAASGDIFASSEQQPSGENLDREDLDITFPDQYLIFPSDATNDLFAELAPTESTISSAASESESPQEIRNSQQPGSHLEPRNPSATMSPEAVDFAPEFTNQSGETSFDSLQSIADLELDFLDTFDQNNEENQQVSFKDTPTKNSLFQQPQDLVDDLFAKETEFEVASMPTTPATSETKVLEDDAALEYIRAQAEEIDDGETPFASVLDDFADLEALLGEENDFLTAPNQVTPVAANNVINQAFLSPELADEFSDLEQLPIAEQTISHSPTVISSTSKNQRPPRRGARFEETMRVPVKHLGDMSNLVGELVVNRNTLEQNQERQRQSLDNLLHQVQELSDLGSRMQELYERSLLEGSLLASRKNKESVSHANDFNSDRGFSELEMDRFTPFHTLSQEMIEMIVRVRESASDINFVSEETEHVARQLGQVTTQLQEKLTKARMQPFSQAIDGWQRGVRDIAIKYGSQVELVIEGGDTFIDKMIVEHLRTPLNHLLNNAIAHGIETPQKRTSQGKPNQGIITVRAFHQGNQTVISVSDDGAGIDLEQVKAKAIKLGWITPPLAKIMSDQDVYELLFMHGFSTKDQADQLAGRGIGMDVVRTLVSEIRGTINIDSTVGKGTTFTIRLPLTLSICKAVCCVSDKAIIAFPMDGVEDTLDIPVKSIQQNADGQKFISWRDTMLPLRPLKEILTFNRQLSRGSVYGGNRADDIISVIVVRSANTLIALEIDQVLNEQEIVIKQFEGPAPKPIGVAGATVLGDGRIMPVADVLEIIDIFQGRTAKQSSVTWEQKTTFTLPDTSATKIDPTVLIVDDSITVRELLSLTFNKAGYRVQQARDGQEAWDKLRSGLPCDIVFCDIEMPRCDGLELLSRIQKDPTLNHLPIAMLTSRGADKHRQMAVQLGASGYFTKPYLEEALLEAASRMLKGEKLVNSANNA